MNRFFNIIPKNPSNAIIINVTAMETLEQNVSRVCRRDTQNSAFVVQSEDDLNEIKTSTKKTNVQSVLNHQAYTNKQQNTSLNGRSNGNRTKRLLFIRKLKNACLSFNNGHAVLVMVIVLLFNGGYATARPNLNSNSLDNVDKVVSVITVY